MNAKHLNWTWAIVAVLAFVGVFVWFAATRLARPGGSDVTVGTASRIDHDLAVAGRSVLVDTELQGDLAAAGSRLVINQRVGGYVLAAGSQVEINGAVDNDLWAVGGNLRVRAPVAENAWLAGGTVVLEPEASVGRGAAIVGRNVHVGGRVGGDLRIGADKATVAAEVRGTLRANTDRLRLWPGAVVHGDVIVRGDAAAEIAPEARVLGTVRHHRPAGPQWNIIGWLGKWLFVFLSILLISALAMLLARPWTVRIGERIAAQPGPTLLTGFGVVVVLPLLILLVAITAIGLPLAVLLTALYVAATIAAGVFVSYWIGGYIPHGRPDSAFGRIVAGALLISLLAALPWAGPIAQFAIVVTGFGALVLECASAWRRIRGGHDAPEPHA